MAVLAVALLSLLPGAALATETFTITPTAGQHGSITPGTPVEVEHGGSATFAVVPDACYHVADVLVDGVSIGATTTVTFSNVTSDHTIAATFAPHFPDPVLQAEFVSMYGHAPTDQELLTLKWLNCPNKNITSLTGLDTYCPNLIGVILANNHVSDISPLAPMAANLIYVGLENNELTDISVLAPMHEYMVLHSLNVSGNYLDLTSGSSTMNVINTVASRGVHVSYTPQRNLTINATAGPHGSITPSGAVAVQPGSDAVFTITPDAGYRIADVLVDGESVGAVSSYTFTHVVAQGHTISATFEEN